MNKTKTNFRNRMISEQGISKIESYMYEDHEMLKRAATQCIVNLLLSDEVCVK